jgi:hypothetical protein
MTDEDICGAKTSDGTPCQKAPMENGRCYHHGGASTGPPEGSANALTHGATATPSNLIDHLSDSDREWVDRLYEAYLEAAPFDEDSPKRERLYRTCVMMWQEWSGTSTVIEEGPAKESVVGVKDTGEPIVDHEQHHLVRYTSDLNDKVRMNLKDLGLLDDPAARGRKRPSR